MKIPCKDDRFFFHLYIVDSLEGCSAKVSPYHKINPTTGEAIPGCCGDVYFVKTAFRTGIIAHESLHMALAYLRTIDDPICPSDTCDDTEESIALHTGWFAARLGEIYWKLQWLTT